MAWLISRNFVCRSIYGLEDGKLKKNYIVACSKPWFDNEIENLAINHNSRFYLINNKNDFNLEKIRNINPYYIFFPHWSYLIPKSIYKKYNCIIFHMTDLPFGRGGSPLQNLIVRGFSNTMISAIKCEKEIDSGDLFLKKPLNLNGDAEEIYLRAKNIIKKMIIQIVKENPKPYPQVGQITQFARRKPEEGDWSEARDLDEVFNYIRMLDAEGYPNAFINFGKFRLEFSRASRKEWGIISDVKIKLRSSDE